MSRTSLSNPSRASEPAPTLTRWSERLPSLGLASIEECQLRYRTIRDYTCTFSKRERIKGQLTPLHVLIMKVRTQPTSIYLKFRQPFPGREAIYVAGRNDGKVLAHDVGLIKLLAGLSGLNLPAAAPWRTLATRFRTPA